MQSRSRCKAFRQHESRLHSMPQAYAYACLLVSKTHQELWQNVKPNDSASRDSASREASKNVANGFRKTTTTEFHGFSRAVRQLGSAEGPEKLKSDFNVLQVSLLLIAPKFGQIWRRCRCSHSTALDGAARCCAPHRTFM